MKKSVYCPIFVQKNGYFFKKASSNSGVLIASILCLWGCIVIGIPNAVISSGTSFVTVVPAAVYTLSPIFTGATKFVLQPINALLPILGEKIGIAFLGNFSLFDSFRERYQEIAQYMYNFDKLYEREY